MAENASLTIKTPPGTVRALALDPKGFTIVSAHHGSSTNDRSVRFWSTQNGQPRGVLVLPQSGRAGEIGSQEWLALSPEGHFRASAENAFPFVFQVQDEKGVIRDYDNCYSFAAKFNYKNDPDKVNLLPRAASTSK